MIVSVLNQKGGVGKTTITVNLARELQAGGKRVLLVDSDPQGSARNWHNAGNGDILDVIGLDRPTLDKDVKKLSQSYDWILIDGAPQLDEMIIPAIKAADVILIPVQPSPYDIWAAEDLIDVIKRRQELADGLPKAAILISRQIANTIIGREVRDVLLEYGLPVFEAGTFQRIIYAKTAAEGKTVIDTEPNSEAALEIKMIAKELREFVS